MRVFTVGLYKSQTMHEVEVTPRWGDPVDLGCRVPYWGGVEGSPTGQVTPLWDSLVGPRCRVPLVLMGGFQARRVTPLWDGLLVPYERFLRG